MSRIFLLSPANASGLRAKILVRPEANFELARRLQIGDVTIGEAFAFCSGLYFRGKLAYAKRFARPPAGLHGIYIITPNRGLLPHDTPLNSGEMRAFGTVSVDPAEPRYTGPLRETLEPIAAADCEVVLLGSIATGKYVDCLLPALGERLRFPAEFVGRGDMSRGGLLLRHTASGEELAYIPVAGAVRRGRRPAKLLRATGASVRRAKG